VSELKASALPVEDSLFGQEIVQAQKLIVAPTKAYSD